MPLNLLASSLLLMGGMLVAAWSADPLPPIPAADIVRNATPGAQRYLDRLQSDPVKAGRISAFYLFMQALILCEAHQAVDRVDTLFAIAEPLFDRDRSSPTYGNIRWYSDDAQVSDRNAIDFCMQYAAPLWLRHRDALPAAARGRLKTILTIGIDGLKGHLVNPGYTNIALMNAAGLIMVGEGLDRADAADEGYARLDRFLTTMWESGTQEYVSPAYYGVDLEILQLIATFAKRERGRQQALALLRYFWTDIALNWFPAAQKLAGARSRDYDYLRGLGSVDQHLLVAGWLPVEQKTPVGQILCAFTAWHPSGDLWTLASTTKPRLVESIWGSDRNRARACWVNPDVALSAAGTGTGYFMDFPLSADLPGPRTRPRIIFVPDGRQDPYGKAKISWSDGHMKTMHLSPFWAAVQRRGDALGLAVYRDRDLVKETSAVQSHIVFPRDAACWLGDERIILDGKVLDRALAAGQPLVLRHGTAAVGMRLVWARDCLGHPASARLVDDGNAFGVARLSVDHQWVAGRPAGAAGAAFWMRVGSGLADDAAFAAWRKAFTVASAEATADGMGVALRVAGVDGPLALKTEAPFTVATVEPAWPRHLLACDGDDLGRRLLADIEPIKGWRERRARVKPVVVSGPVAWEAEAGFITDPMVEAEDANASGGHFTWETVVEGRRSSVPGGVSWPLQTANTGPRYLWARVRAATPANDSLLLGLEQDGRALIANAIWTIGVHKDWTWVRFTPEGAKVPTPITLPAGRSDLLLRTREPGAQVDRLFLAPTADGMP